MLIQVLNQLLPAHAFGWANHHLDAVRLLIVLVILVSPPKMRAESIDL
jgi:hypothetical protein